MSFVILVLFIFGIIVFQKIKIDENAKKISLSYLVITGVILFISSLNPLNLYDVSSYTYFLVIASIIAFILSFVLIGKNIIKGKLKYEELNENISVTLNKLLRSKIFISIIVFNLILVMIYKIKYELIIQDLPKQEIRMARFNSLFSNTIEVLFFNYIITGFVNILSIIFSVCLVHRKFKNFTFVLMALNIVIYSLIGYGRMLYFNIFLYVVISILLKSDIKSYINRKSLAKLFMVCLIVFVIFTSMIYMRIGKKNSSVTQNIVLSVKNQFEQVIEYLVGEYRLLDYFIQNGFEDFNSYTFGRATFAGVEEIVLYPIKAFNIEISSFNNMISKYTQKYILIGGNNSYFNAYYTCIMNYYLDFGVLGVIIFPILYSVVVIIALKNYYVQKNVYSLMLLSFVLLNLFFGVIRWNYQSGTTVFVLIILVFLNVLKKLKLSEN